MGSLSLGLVRLISPFFFRSEPDHNRLEQEVHAKKQFLDQTTSHHQELSVRFAQLSLPSDLTNSLSLPPADLSLLRFPSVRTHQQTFSTPPTHIRHFLALFFRRRSGRTRRCRDTHQNVRTRRLFSFHHYQHHHQRSIIGSSNTGANGNRFEARSGCGG